MIHPQRINGKLLSYPLRKLWGFKPPARTERLSRFRQSAYANTLSARLYGTFGERYESQWWTR